MNQDPLFPLPDPVSEPILVEAPTRRIWTESKAIVIAEYLRQFVLITKHGTYIDGFAGRHDKKESWAANLVLQIEPPWLRHFRLYDIDTVKVRELNDLKRLHPDRDVDVKRADFNGEAEALLQSGLIGPNEATFCLIDQFTFECDWRTVQKLAEHPKSQFKIEIFYFLANGWMDRALQSSLDDRREVSAWWGSGDWHFLRDMSGLERARIFQDRFTKELGYRSAIPWAIYDKGSTGRIAYFMIHATDHPRAPSLMEKAYGSRISRFDDVPLFDLDGGWS